MSQQVHNRKELEIWQACDALSAQEQNVTYKAVGDSLEALGFCRGSNSDIARYLKTWKIKQEGNNASSESAPVVSDPVLRAISDVHQQLQADADAEIHAMRVQCDSEIKEVRAQLAQQMTEYEQQSRAHQSAQEQVDALLAQQEVLQTELQDYKEQHAQLSAALKQDKLYQQEFKHDVAAQKTELIKQYQSTINALKSAYSESKTQIETCLAQANTEITRLSNQLTQAISSQQEAQSIIKQQQEKLTALIEQMSQQKNNAIKQQQILQSECSELKVLCAMLTEAREQAAVRIEDMRLNIAHLNKQLEQKKASQIRLKKSTTTRKTSKID